MSKNVKYISSDHFGAPQLLGDRWGYGVEMFRKCLCEGFNERTDITNINVIDAYQIEIIYASPHNYQIDQTILISGTTYAELNAEFVIINESANIIRATSYIDLAAFNGLKLSGLSTVKSKVAPLGFIEKFKEGNKSAFTTDEEEAFFVIDDTTPAYWGDGSSTYTLSIAPLVYMTDKMSDINTDGKYIVPYMSANPTWYKQKSFMDAAFQRNGLWNFFTFGNYGNGSGNTAANRLIPTKYTIIGNGRLFYFIPEYINTVVTNVLSPIYSFGKINNSFKGTNNLNYMLMASPKINVSVTLIANGGVVYPYRIYTFNRIYRKEYITGNLIDIGASNCGLLKIKNSSRNVNFDNRIFEYGTNNIESNSGGIAKSNYPDNLTYKYYLSNIHTMTNIGYTGLVSGIMHVANGNNVIHKNRTVLKYKFGNNNKRLYCIQGYFADGSSSTSITMIYNISLENGDWYNYD